MLTVRMRRWAFLPWPLLGGCFLLDLFTPLVGSSASDWYETGPIPRPLEEITTATRDFLTRAGYSLPKFDAASASLETDWTVSLNPHWREGFRAKVFAMFVSGDGGGINVRIRSLREINDEAKHPMNPEKADWIAGSLHPKAEELIPVPAQNLRQQLRLKFFGLERD